ncbi:hypothetical protein HGRIS_001598 [Hohenbuehelia grisea]|uniref:Uncharacterized protein n=1 Tax=Hohenbuehelia grisea TaxID=104357 RepID=A0ABR3JHW5_9AGAR
MFWAESMEVGFSCFRINLRFLPKAFCNVESSSNSRSKSSNHQTAQEARGIGLCRCPREASKGTRAAGAKALDNAVWRGAAPTGHAPVQKDNASHNGTQNAGIRAPAKAGRPVSSDTRQRPSRRLPPSIPTFGDSDNDTVEAPQPPKRPRLVKRAEGLFDNDTDVEHAGRRGHVEGDIQVQRKAKPKKRTVPAFDEDADIEEDYGHHHGPGENDSDDDGMCSQPEDQDLAGIVPSQLRSQLRNELPQLGDSNEQSPSSPGIDLPDVELEMTTTTEFEDFNNTDQEEVDIAASANTNTNTNTNAKAPKPSGGHRARARLAEKPTFMANADAPIDTPSGKAQLAIASSGTSTAPGAAAVDAHSPNYGWPTEAHYVPPLPSLPLSLKVQPFPLQQIIRTAIRSATSDYMFKTAYPSDKNHWKGICAILRRCATSLEFSQYAEHFEKDVAFGEEVAQAMSVSSRTLEYLSDDVRSCSPASPIVAARLRLMPPRAPPDTIASSPARNARTESRI